MTVMSIMMTPFLTSTDLVLSSSLGRDADFISSLDLTGTTPSHIFDPPTDIESEYFTTEDQVCSR